MRRYISTYAVQKSRDIDFGSWKRDALLFKSMALSQLLYWYFFPSGQQFELDWVSLLMMATGYGVSMLATKRLGVDRTYFGAELGVVEPLWVDKFPYG
jgi:hypothetical protein